MASDSVVPFSVLFSFLAFLLFQQDTFAGQPASETQAILESKLPRVSLHEQDELSKFDDFARHLMVYANAPGVQLAVAKGGQLKYFKGFGVANIHTKEPVTTHSVMRYNSVTKAITGTAILKLVETGQLRLDDKPFSLLGDLVPPKNAKVDPRLFTITVQNLLQHTAGWNATLTQFDPSVMPGTLKVSNSLGTAVPATPNDQVRFIKSIALDFDPGTAFEYSNNGYNVLGRVIEKVTGMKYADYIQEHLFHLVGIKGLAIGHSRVEDLEPNEARYYGVQGQDELTVSVFPGQGYVPRSYGFADYSQVDSWGAWVGSAGDMVRFMVHVDGIRKPAILGAEMVYAMLNTPRPTANGSMVGDFRGLQWFVGEVENGEMTLYFQNGGVPVGVDEKGKVTFYFHNGGAPGAHSLCIRLVKEEVSMAFLLNTLPSDISIFDVGAIVNFTSLATSIKEWPHHDLFSD